MNQDPERTPYEVGSLYKEDKRSFSRVGFAILIYTLLTFLLSLLYNYLAKNFFPELAGQEYMYWIAHCLIMYVLSMPIAILILRKGIRPITPLPDRKLSTGEFLMLIPCAYAISYVGNYIGTTVNTLLNFITGGAYSASGLTNVMLDTSPIGTFLVVVIIAPIMEELLFRKFVIDSLRPWGQKIAVWVSALFFGLIHGNIEQFFYAFLLGAGLGWIYLKTGKMRYNIALHMIFNLLGGFIPMMIMRYGFDYNALIELLNTLLVTDSAAPEYSQYVAELFTDFQPGLSILIGYQFSIMGLSLAGGILLIAMNRRIRFAPGEREIDRAYIGETVFMAPGILIAIIASLAMMVYNMYTMFGT